MLLVEAVTKRVFRVCTAPFCLRFSNITQHFRITLFTAR